MVDSSIWDQEIAAPASVISFVDENVLKELPKDSRVVSISPYGASHWTRSAEIKTIDSTGDKVSFFMKVAQGDIGKGMVHGEFHSMTAVHNACPDIAPKPVGHGTYKGDADYHFFLCRFHAMTDSIPDIEDFPAVLAELHRSGISPTGKFGFPVTTYQGRLPQAAAQYDTWEECFSSSVERFFKFEETQGPDEEMAALRKAFMEKVIPRLLRPLETGGNKIRPRLVHGNLWDGNTSVDAETGRPLIFVACSSYAHHEYELAPWRPLRHKIGRPYVLEYLKHFPISEPAVDFDDRNALYCVRFNLCSSALYPGNPRFRNMVKEEMRSLVEKFPLGYEGKRR